MLRETRRLVVGALVAVLALWSVAAPRISIAQTFSDGWIRIHMDASGKWFNVNLRTLEFADDSRSIVSFMLLEDGSRGYEPWEIHCRDGRIKANGIFVSIVSDGNTVRRTLYNGFCGFQYEGVTWTLVGAIPVKGDSTRINSFMFFDLNSIKSIHKPFLGRSVQVLEVGLENYVFKPIAKLEFAYNCSAPISFATKVTGYEFNVFKGEIGSNTLAHSTSLLVCSDKFFKSGTRNPLPKGSMGLSEEATPNRSVSAAKKTCADLGFKAGSEKYGECVLKLSR